MRSIIRDHAGDKRLVKQGRIERRADDTAKRQHDSQLYSAFPSDKEVVDDYRSRKRASSEFSGKRRDSDQEAGYERACGAATSAEVMEDDEARYEYQSGLQVRRPA